MNIFHVTPYYAPAYSFGGVVRMVEGLATAQVKQGHQVTILTTDAYTITERYQGDLITTENDIRVVRCRNAIYPLRRYNLNTPLAMAKHAREIIPTVDIVHLHEFRTVENQIVVSIAKKHQKPVVLSPHGTLTYTTGRSALKSIWDSVLSPRITSHIQHVIALAQSELDDIQQLWSQFNAPQTTFSTVPNGVNMTDYQTLPSPDALRGQYGLGDATVILFMGRLHQRKGIGKLAKAFTQLQLPNTKLLCVGPDEGMQAEIEVLNNPNIILTGYLDGEARLAALALADLFVLPAIGEGLSMAVLEAMSAGLPVLLSHGCNMPQAETSNAGIIIEPTVENLKQALQSLLSDPDALRIMGQNGQQLIADQFTWQKVAQQMEISYRSVIDNSTC